MNSVSDIKIKQLADEDPRYLPEAYYFITSAVTFAVGRLSEPGHVTARELLRGIRDYAEQEYGALAADVMISWGINTASDVGELVYSLINAGLLSASKDDKRSDFDIEFDLLPQYTTTQYTANKDLTLLPKID